MRTTAADVYADQLSSKGYGYPLWCPEHPVNDEIFLGHVGHIADGAFHPYFNVTLPSTHKSNQRGVPQGFTMLDFDRESLVWNSEQLLRPGAALCSQTVKSLDTSIEAGARCVINHSVGIVIIISYAFALVYARFL